MFKNNANFQIVRAVGFILIFLSHCSAFMPVIDNFMWGSAGVSLFIILSGYLVIYTGKGSAEESIASYVLRKIRKVYPLHVVMTAAVLPFSIYGIVKGTETLRNLALKLAVSLTMTQSFIPDSGYYFCLNAVSWYLSLFLLFSFSGLPAAKFIMKYPKTVAGGVSAVVILWLLEIAGAIVFKDYANAHWLLYINPFMRLADFAAGALLAKLHTMKWGKEYHIFSCGFMAALPVVAIVYCIPSVFRFHEVTAYSALWFPVSIAVIELAALLKAPGSKNREGGVLMLVGGLSMELFLIHQVLIRYFSKFAEGTVFFNWYISVHCL